MPPAAQRPTPRVCVPSQEKAAFRELISQLELEPKCKGLPFSSFLILPFQRITRLKLLVQVQPPPPDPQTGFPRLSCGHSGALFQVIGFLGGLLVQQILSKLFPCAPSTFPGSEGVAPAPREPHRRGNRLIHAQPGSGHGCGDGQMGPHDRGGWLATASCRGGGGSGKARDV